MIERDSSKDVFAFTLGHISVYYNDTYLVENTHDVSLSLWDRFTSWPWKPWKKTYQIKVTEPDELIYFNEDKNRYVGHASAIHQLSVKIISSLETINNKSNDDN